MNNPINNQVFDTRDLIDYQNDLAQEIVDIWNDENPEFEATDISDILGTNGYEFTQDAAESWENFSDTNRVELEHYKAISDFCDELSGSPDYTYGESVVSDDYFTEYTQELLEDCGYIPKDFPSWIELDWEKTASNVKQDYTSANFENQTYWIRA